MCDPKPIMTFGLAGLKEDIVCATSGKPITITNEHGHFCEDECDLADAQREWLGEEIHETV
ncbi:MAG: hypothetical protein JEZ11_03975 [Desulfobacterales bacterium]|nr:hypothetical protein [Desulfobacterales bacterium]